MPLVLRYFDALRVPSVASTPITPVFVPSAAGLTAGSMPMKGILYDERRSEMAAPVAVLHAITMASAPSSRSLSVISRQRLRINSGLLSPYGQLALSE